MLVFFAVLGLAAVFGLGEQLPAFGDTQLLHTLFFPGASFGSEPALAASEMGSNNCCTDKPTTTDHERGGTERFRGFRELLFCELPAAFARNLPAGISHQLSTGGFGGKPFLGSGRASGLLIEFRKIDTAGGSELLHLLGTTSGELATGEGLQAALRLERAVPTTELACDP